MNLVYLASQSPRRRQLLDQLGVRHELLLPEAHEDAEALEAERAGEKPVDYVQRVARAKLLAAQQRLARSGRAAAPILCADTTVALNGIVLGKPADRVEARVMLEWLSGRTHRVYTAIGVAHGRRRWYALSDSKVRFAAIPAVEIERYVAGGEPFGKAGGYAIQSGIAAWIERIEGSYSGIMGLPLFETAQLLRHAGLRF